jgi:hypothetical protein
MNLTGTPNGHEFIANPQRVWLINSSHAVLNGMDLGPVGALDRQARLDDFFIPQRGLFALARAFLANAASRSIHHLRFQFARLSECSVRGHRDVRIHAKPFPHRMRIRTEREPSSRPGRKGLGQRQSCLACGCTTERS